MKMILSALSLVSLPALATPLAPGDHPAINTVVLENTVEVYSSRQNVWICDIRINNRGADVGSDNRVYYTATRFDKGRDNNPVVYNGVMEAPVDGSSKFASIEGNYNQGRPHFNTTYETRYSNIRLEAASLNYGVEVELKYCGELPFAYQLLPGFRHWEQQLSITQSVHDLLRGAEYISEAGLAFSTFGSWTGSEDEIGAFGSEWNDMANNIWSGVWSDYESGSSIDVIGDSHEVNWRFHDIHTSGVNSLCRPVCDLAKWQVSTIFSEGYNFSGGPQKPRLKGLTEGVMWRQRVESSVDIKDSVGPIPSHNP